MSAWLWPGRCEEEANKPHEAAPAEPFRSAHCTAQRSAVRRCLLALTQLENQIIPVVSHCSTLRLGAFGDLELRGMQSRDT